MTCADQLRPPSGGLALAQGLRIATRPRPPGLQVIGKLNRYFWYAAVRLELSSNPGIPP